MKKSNRKLISGSLLLTLFVLPLPVMASPHQHLDIVLPERVMATKPADIKILLKEDTTLVKQNGEISVECATRWNKLTDSTKMEKGKATANVTFEYAGMYLCNISLKDSSTWASIAVDVVKE